MIAWIGSALRRLRDERLTALGLIALILVTAFLAAAAPRLLDRVADDTLHSTILAATPANRNIQFLRQDRFEPTPDGAFTAVTFIGDLSHKLLPRPIADLVETRAWTIETGRWQLPEVAGDPATMRLRIQPDAADRLRLDAGRWPTDAISRIPNPVSREIPTPKIAVFEVALSSATADALNVAVGDTLALVIDTSDPMIGRGHALTLGAIVVGTFVVDDDTDPFWLGNTELARPSIRSPGGDLRITDATAFLAPEAYAGLMDETRNEFLPLRYTYREYVDPARLDSSNVDSLLVEFRRLEAALPSTNVTFNQETGLRTGLRAILDGYRARWGSATAILTVGAIGPAALALGSLGLVAMLAAQRRRSALALSRGRGASLTQVVVAVIAEGLVLGAPASLLAIVAALVLVPADPVGLSIAAGSAVAALAVVLLVLATVPATSGHSFGPARDAYVPRRPSARRLLFEGLVVLIALLGAYLLRERGIRGSSSTGQLGEADPFVAAVPALIGIAAGLIVVRLFPYPMRFLAWLARRRRDLVPVLAMRRASQGPAAAAVLIVLLATAAIGTFSSVILVHLDRAAEAVAWREVGAAYRVDGTSGALRTGFDPAALPDVEASAVAFRVVVNIGQRNLRVEFVALATSDYDRVVTGTPADPDLPVDLFASNPDVIPIVVSRAVVERIDGVKVGDEFPITIEGYTLPALVVGIAPDMPSISNTTQFAIASRDQLKARFPRAPLLPSMAFLRAPDGSLDAIRATLKTQIPIGAALVSRAEVRDEVRSAPTSRAVVAGVAAAAFVAVAYAILAVAAALALAGAGRAVEVAHLRTLGLTGRQAAGLVVVEHGPTVVVAFGAGVALGLAMFLVLRPGLGLEALVGSRADVPLAIDPGTLVLVLGGIVAVIVLGLILGTLMQRSAAPVAAVRRGFE